MKRLHTIQVEVQRGVVELRLVVLQHKSKVFERQVILGVNAGSRTHAEDQLAHVAVLQ